MRLTFSFFMLLIIATFALGLEMRELPQARDGDLYARGFAFAAAVTVTAAVVLLTRIVARVDAVRRGGNEARR